MEINRASLLADLKKALPGIDTGKSPIVGADSFLFSGNMIHTFNSSVGVSIPTATDGLRFAVKASEFYKFLTKGGSPEATLEFDEKVVTCKMGRCKAKLTIVSSGVDKYVDNLGISEMEFEQLPETFCDGIKLCRVEDSVLGGIFIDGDKMIATNGKVATMFNMQRDMEKMWIPDAAIKSMLKIGEPVAYKLSDSWGHFKYSDGTIFSCALRDIERYPSEALLGRLKMCEVDETCIKGKLPDGIVEAISRVSIFSENKNGSLPIDMELNCQGILVSSQKNSGACEEEIPWDTGFAIEQGDAINCTIDAGFVQECFNKAIEFFIKDVGEGRVIAFTSDCFIQVTEI